MTSESRVVWEMRAMRHGTVVVVAKGPFLQRIHFSRTPEEACAAVLASRPEAVSSASTTTREALSQLYEYFNGHRQSFSFDLDVTSLTPFARAVHRALIAVPYGATVSYGRLAELAGHPGAARAVGRVMASNPFPLVVPCHRVITAGGAPGYYSAANGTVSKEWLLALESRRH